MMRVLIPYGTTEGLTARISEYVAEVIRGHTDTSRAYVYTEWDGVKHFVEEFLETLLPEAARDPHS